MTQTAKSLQDVIAERKRQVEVEGWTPDHDDMHQPGEMALAAGCYCFWSFPNDDTANAARAFWPWEKDWFKPKDVRRDLVRAAALILAEIERHDRHN